ncbi:MAG: hypothetical protein HYX74_11765 [Acidobacteria bacterium]|nr:hypothetical protein [Acidobacteriota bacterium]
MFGNRIRLDDELFEKIKQCSAKAGYASPEEFVVHVLEKEIARLTGPGEGGRDSDAEIRKRLQGLGYID